MAEATKPAEQVHAFKAEVAQLLDLVVHSLYTDKEIFVRELISNASDALEKMRYLSLTEKELPDPDRALAIHITTDDKAGSFVIRDSGIGMTRDEASENLGTIAHSGSKEFLKEFTQKRDSSAELIGQFGVGFYSAFMVAERVTAESRSWRPDAMGVVWSSRGEGSFTLDDRDGLERGTKITLKLRESEQEYAKPERIKQLVRHYSSFVPFPVYVDGEQVNTVQALWTKSPSEVTDEQYKEFYQFVAGRSDDPTFRLHYSADAPLAIRAILFVPGDNIEQFGMERQRSGVSLYCKKVLIQQHAEKLLPEYLRFVQGVVDSEDLPLNVSRETMQDSALLNKLSRVLARRLIKLLKDQTSSEPERYGEFFRKFGTFIKEGVTSDMDNRKALADLLRFASSSDKEDKPVSLTQYVRGMKENQKVIYFISGANREAIEAGPYLEALTERGFEVLYCYDAVDDFVMTSLREYDGKRLVSADQDNLDLPEDGAKESAQSERETGDLARWLKDILGDRIEDVRASKRLVKSPALLVNPDPVLTTGMQRIMQAANRESIATQRMVLEINPKHRILMSLNKLREAGKPTELAREACEQLLDNAKISAGLLVDPRVLVERSTRLLERALEEGKAGEER